MNLEHLINEFDLVTDTEEGLDKFKKYILDLAIQGQITKQDLDTEPAEKLVERIKEKKERLYEQGKVRKPKDLEPIEDNDNPFDLPQNWVWSRMDDVTEVVRGITFPASEKNQEYEEGLICCLKTSNVQEEVIWDDVIYVDEKFIKSEEKLLREGDILISMANSYELVGKVALVRNLEKRSSLGGFISAIRTLGIDNKYLFYLLRSEHIQSTFRESSSQTTNIANLSLKRILPILFPIPPLEEQKRIVKKIETLFSQVDELEQKVQQDRQVDERLQVAVLNDLQSAETPEVSKQSWQRLTDHFEQIYRKPEHIDQLKQAILNEAVRGRLIPQDPNDEPAEKLLEHIKEEKQRLYKEGKIRKPKDLDPVNENEIPYELPKVWVWARVGDIAKVVEYGTSQKSHKEPHGVPMLRMGNIDEFGNLTLDSLKYVDAEIDDLPRLYLKDKDLLFNRTNSYELVGKMGFYHGEDDKYTFASYLIRVQLFQDLTSVEYLHNFINSENCRKVEIEPEITQQTNQANFNGTKLQHIRVPLPPLEEQKRIVGELNSLFAWCDELKKKLSRSQQTDQRLLEALVNGRAE